MQFGKWSGRHRPNIAGRGQCATISGALRRLRPPSVGIAVCLHGRADRRSARHRPPPDRAASRGTFIFGAQLRISLAYTVRTRTSICHRSIDFSPHRIFCQYNSWDRKRSWWLLASLTGRDQPPKPNVAIGTIRIAASIAPAERQSDAGYLIDNLHHSGFGQV